MAPRPRVRHPVRHVHHERTAEKREKARMVLDP